jgi:hypothetical protein
MPVFCCSACGGHTFALSSTIGDAWCADCDRSLGPWQDLRLELLRRLKTAKPDTRVETEFAADKTRPAALRA